MGKYIDLHVHSTNSDGKYNVYEIIKMAKNNGVKTLSITDHDDIRSALENKKI